EKVFTKIRHSGLTLKANKSFLAFDEIKCLVFITGQDGIKLDEDKVEAVRAFKRPSTITDLKSYLGLTQFLARCIPAYSEVVKPLRALLKGNPTKLPWNDEAEKAFEELKKIITEAPVVIPFDSTKTCYLVTDASDSTLSAVLMQ